MMILQHYILLAEHVNKYLAAGEAVFALSKVCMLTELIMSVLPGANIHARTQSGDTAFTYACENGHTDVAEVLLEHGAELVSLAALRCHG